MKRWVYLFAIIVIIFLLHCDGGKIGIPELRDPIGGKQVSLPVTFIWTAVAEAEKYAIEVDTTTDFWAPVISAEKNDTNYTTTTLDLKKYYWRVAAIDKNGKRGNFSNIDSFVVTGSAYPRNLIATIPVGDYPISIDITPNGAEVWVNHWAEPSVFVNVISTATNQVTHQIAVTNVGNSELRISKDGNSAYYCGEWNMDSAGVVEISTSSYTQTRMMGYLEGSPPVKIGPRGYGIALTQLNNYIYAANTAAPDNHGCIAKFALSSGNMVDSVHLPWIYDVDPNQVETKLYATSQSENIFYEIDPNTLTVTRQIPLGNGPEIILLTSDDRYIFVSHLNDSVYVVDLSTFTVVKKFEPEIGEFGMAFTPDEKYLFLCDAGSHYISIFDVADPTNPKMVEKLSFPAAGSFSELVFNGDGSRAYVVAASGYVYVLAK